ncbi:hypothetical protein BG842_03500 [Haladaptatus sp. W1]|uniref:hypothetical protein n=1 Tax=Haladaptatus sp. W1 TaxID=1897478 RepID=UPI000849BDD6|nr:hypothetical protein [Haladaptatus sp. W1]ODR80534.1 hypothetical protein BG842_03500 [Haladaptatus sp. W1]
MVHGGATHDGIPNTFTRKYDEIVEKAEVSYYVFEVKRIHDIDACLADIPAKAAVRTHVGD